MIKGRFKRIMDHGSTDATRSYATTQKGVVHEQFEWILAIKELIEYVIWGSELQTLKCDIFVVELSLVFTHVQKLFSAFFYIT